MTEAFEHAALDRATLDQLFNTARTYNGFTGEVGDETLRKLYELLKWGPTAANSTPARFVFVKSQAAKEKLRPALSAGNLEKTLAAPVTVIVGHDLDFVEKMGYLFPHKDVRGWFPANPEDRLEFALLNGSLQAAYLILAARALGLDAGPMTGFDHAKVDAAFFAGTRIKSNILVNLGVGDPATLFPRNPRLPFDEAARIE